MKLARLEAASQLSGIPVRTLRYRTRRKGMTLSEAINYLKPASLSARAREAGIPRATVWWRVKKIGMSPERALIKRPT